MNAAQVSELSKPMFVFMVMLKPERCTGSRSGLRRTWGRARSRLTTIQRRSDEAEEANWEDMLEDGEVTKILTNNELTK